jgi:hypothetical protein
MGLGFVLLVWGIVGVILAGGAALSLVWVVRVVAVRTGRVKRGWFVTAAALPFVSLAYAASVFVAYGVYCEVVRDVDLGFGDSARVPLGHGYRLVMIDTAEPFIVAPDNRQMHWGLKRVGATEDFIAGEDERGFFVITSRQRAEQTLSSESDLKTALPSGIGDRLQLLPPDDFYQQHRWGWPDIVAVLLIVVPPLAAFSLLALRFARSLSAADRPLQPASGTPDVP